MCNARKATLKDIPELKKLYFDLMVRFEKMDSFDTQDRKYWKTGAEKQLRKMIRGNEDDFIVLEEGNEIIGFAHLKILKREPIFKIKTDPHIEATFIKPGFRGKGHGKVLFRECVKFLKKKGAKHITVGTHAKDSGANSFWKKMGFREYNFKYRK